MNVLIVDDERSMCEVLELLVRGWGHTVVTGQSVAEAQRVLDSQPVDLVITDIHLGHESGMTVLKAARSHDFPPEVIVITAYGTPATAIEAIREGAYDYITKPFDNNEFRLLVSRALEKREIRAEVLRLRRGAPDAQMLVGKSPAIKAVWDMVERVAASPKAMVLVTGESGTGKELVARGIHRLSERARFPFLAINCAALAEGVLESELFGHRKGAFTGADRDRQGLLVAAGQGTVFLDEVGEIPLSIQVKLLRVLQERNVRPVGGTDEVRVEARIIAATNRSLENEVKAGRFREDLWYRLNVINIHVPPLRERGSDVGDLANFFLAKVADDLGRPGLRFTDETLGVLGRYPFPGNVRQLQNIVERAATLSSHDLLEVSTLPPSLRGEHEVVTEEVAVPAGFSLEQHLDSLERQFLMQALKQSNGAKMKAAERLGLTFRSFRYRLAKHGLSDAPE